MKSTRSYLMTAFAVAFSVLLVIPLWAVFGVLLPGEEAGGGDRVMAADFQRNVDNYIEEHGLPDGSVEADHDGPVYVMASQYTYSPNKIRLKTGEHYEFQFLS